MDERYIYPIVSSIIAVLILLETESMYLGLAAGITIGAILATLSYR